MMKLGQRPKQILTHICFWSVFFTFTYSADYLFDSLYSWWDDLITILINAVFTFYATYFSILRIKRSRKITFIYAACLFCLAILINIGLNHIYRYTIFVIFELYPEYKFNFINLFVKYSLGYFYIPLFAIGYFYLTELSKSKINLLESEVKNNMLAQNLKQTKLDKLAALNQAKEAENNRIKTEYNFLKTQINPHFLYNTLSMFYGSTITKLPSTAKGILLLTDLMRYSLNVDNKADDGKVTIEQEVENLRKFFELQNMRFDGDLQYKIVLDIAEPCLKILPHIFLTFGENAIKHGVSDDSLSPIHISVKNSFQLIEFSISNKIRKIASSDSTGIGINNAIARLRLEYGDNFKFDQSIQNDVFKVNLNIQINN